MSRWFAAHLRRGGRVHHDGLSPQLLAQLRRRVRAAAVQRAHRRAARAGFVMGLMALLIAIWIVLAGRGGLP